MRSPIKTLEPRNSQVPGPRMTIKLDLAEASLPHLLRGLQGRVWLSDEGDGVYALHATESLGDSRKRPGKPAVDLLVELVNELGDALDAEDVPQRVRDTRDEIAKRWQERTGPHSEPSDD